MGRKVSIILMTIICHVSVKVCIIGKMQSCYQQRITSALAIVQQYPTFAIKIDSLTIKYYISLVKYFFKYLQLQEQIVHFLGNVSASVEGDKMLQIL